MEKNIVSKIIKHIKLVFKHKWLVFKFSCKLGIPFRGLMHDFSKFSIPEFAESVKYYDGKISPVVRSKQKNGYSKEEMKFVHESRKILHSSEFEVNCTCVRVPVIRCHSESITLECTNEIELNKIKNVLKNFNGIKLYEPYPTPLECNDQDLIYVGRIRKDYSIENGLNLWCVADNLRKGAASNAIQIVEGLIKCSNN